MEKVVSVCLWGNQALIEMIIYKKKWTFSDFGAKSTPTWIEDLLFKWVLAKYVEPAFKYFCCHPSIFTYGCTDAFLSILADLQVFWSFLPISMINWGCISSPQVAQKHWPISYWDFTIFWMSLNVRQSNFWHLWMVTDAT